MRLTQFLTRRVGELTKKYSNLPERYIERTTLPIYYEQPKDPQFNWEKRCIRRKSVMFVDARPWEAHHTQHNTIKLRSRKIFVKPIRDWPMFKGDRVEILVGKDKGKQGEISRVYQERNWVIVHGLNWEISRYGHKREGFIETYYQKEKPLSIIDEVKLVDPSDMQPTDIEWRYTDYGERVRVSVRTGRIIPMPLQAEETYDYKSKAQYVDSVKDTNAKVATERTFTPKLKTFDMDIMDEMGIKDDRTFRKTYWY